MCNVCKNCGESTQKNFCSNCGQSVKVGRVNLYHILHNFLHGIVHIDSGFFYTMKELTFRPGKTIHDYFEGKRVRLFKPFGYFFILITAYVFLSHLFIGSVLGSSDVVISEVKVDVDNEGLDTTSVNTLSNIKEITEMVLGVLEKYFSLATLCTIPLISLISIVFFRKQKYNYGEHLVINSYILGQQVLLLILLLPLSYMAYDKVDINSFLWIVQMLVYIYMMNSIFTVYKPWKRIVYSFFAYIVLMLLMIILMSILMTVLLVFKHI